MRQTVSLKKQYQIVDDLLVQRIHKLLPELMEETGYDMWIILCREYNEDPVFTTMLPSLCLTARRLSCLVFVKQGERFEALNFGRPSEHLNRVYTQGYTDSSRDQLEMLAEYVRKVEPQRIGINCSPINAMCDGLSKSMYDKLYQALDPQDRDKLCSAYPLAVRWIETRTQEELSRYRTVYQLAMEICEEAFSRKVITPGVTTTTEVEEWIAQEINRLGLTFWFSPHVDVQRQGLDGVGRFQEIVSQEHITGRTGNEILKTCLERAQQEGIAAMLYCHPIGYFGHSAGTVVGLWDMQQGIGEYGDFPLHKNTCYALELNTESCLKEWGGQRVRFSAEETVAFTEDGKLSYLYPGREKIYAI